MTERLTYSVAEAAELLGVSTQHVYALIREGVLQTVELGPKRKRISVKWLHEYVDGPKDAA